ncbi:class II fructose-bisphosphate aldolase [Lentisphaerota bacterium WC36G]|nr:class II fructose-bisphosphate aldolase [Lentisphaerae bacterium WC36]
MSLISTKEMLQDARARQYAVPMFDVCNYETMRGVVDAANEMNSPVMLAGLKPDLKGVGLDYFIAMAKVAAQNANVPVAIHLDHATSFDECKRVIDAGFNSVMIDASSHSFTENVAKVKEVVNYAHQRGVTVEAELGHVPDAIAGTGEAAQQGIEHKNPKECLTQPTEVLKFVEQTNVDALAIAIGTAHGSYVSTPKLEIELLKEINAISPACLVLHGGSGTPEGQIKAAVANGITKVNVFTDILIAMFSELKTGLNESDNMGKWPIFVYEKPILALQEVVKNKIITFNSQNKS